MIILQILAFLFMVACTIGFLHLRAGLESILQWIQHVNDKLTRIEYSKPERDRDEVESEPESLWPRVKDGGRR